jgi:hypothetical protein
LMHVLSNGEYNLNGFVFKSLIPSFTNLVFYSWLLVDFQCAVVTTIKS